MLSLRTNTTATWEIFLQTQILNMKNIRLYYFLAFIALGLTFTSCDDDDDTNKIKITIDEPMNGETITDCAEVHIHVDIEASIENHEIEIVLHTEDDVNDKIIDYDAHEHDKEIKFDQEVDLCSYPAGTCFHLEVVACVDHDCAEKSTADVEFCLQ